MTTENQEQSQAPALAADENKIIAERRAKLAAIREKGVAFPNDFRRSTRPPTWSNSTAR
jgi:lysyl-tRNA synthetase class 2